MSYLAFARKYRPGDFSEVIGQENIVKRLRESIVSGRIHHAFLFSGPRGVGKTSLARILAKALNCLKFDKPTSAPCLECVSCKEIQQGSSLDVIEIDGASNRGIDEIRQLRENVKFAPSYTRFKVYIIDEVHQITQDAFNALLKTLEEPPAHVKFIFATTNPNKVPVTILSRCQRFNFGLLTEERIIEKLKLISKSENITVDEEILKYVAKASLGSVRDAESIFDQIAPLIIEGMNLKETIDILGQVPEHQIISFAGALLSLKPKESLEIINRIVEEGYDLNNFLTSVIECVRNIILAKLGQRLLSQITELPPKICETILKLSESADMSYLLRIIDVFLEAKRNSKFLNSLRIPFEVAVIKLTYKKEEEKQALPYKEIENDKASSETVQTRKEFGFQHKTASLNLENVSKFVDSLKTGFRHKPKEAHIKKEDVGEDKEFSIEEVESIWQDVLEEISKKKMSVATYLNEAQLLGVEGRIIHVGFPKNLAFHKESLDHTEYKQFVEEILMRKLNRKLGVSYSLIDKIKETPKKSSSQETITKIVNAFDGEVLT
ncbi:MAG: DNA polymerase III subunit gamma/tau [Candidatus Omnitrophica bacterium]|nr:DNA polymerase III subunit gamma/tau [Candidatus Omnitrophota bacterium]